MAKPKETSRKTKPAVKIPDLKTQHNPKGGAAVKKPNPFDPGNG